jgi:nucleoid-associated protein YgaU
MSAWNRALIIFAAAGFTACHSTKSKDSAAEIPESPPASNSASTASLEPEPAPVAAAPVRQESTSAPRARTHVVKPHETLFSLARQYYNGDASKWRKIYDANRDRIENKDSIKVGQELVIPD